MAPRWSESPEFRVGSRSNIKTNHKPMAFDCDLISLCSMLRRKGWRHATENQHDIEAEGVEGFVVCAEYLTYWHSI